MDISEHDRIKELITRRRKQVLVHSIIYYQYDENIITDDQWSKWALELEQLQTAHPDIAEECPYSDAFRNFDHSTGSNLPLDDEYANQIALILIDDHHRND